MDHPKVIVFTCNWNAFSGLEAAGKTGQNYPANILPIRVMCLGRLRTGNILKAFAKGAAGVMLLGCSTEGCRYDTGYQRAEEVYQESRGLLRLLGYGDEQLQMDAIAPEDGAAFVEKVFDFVSALKKDIPKGKGSRFRVQGSTG